jgi:hypothetical protein
MSMITRTESSFSIKPDCALRFLLITVLPDSNAHVLYAFPRKSEAPRAPARGIPPKAGKLGEGE